MNGEKDHNAIVMFVCIYLLSCFVFFYNFFTKTNGHSKRFYDRELEPRLQDSQFLITNFSIFFTRVCFSGTKVNWWIIYKTHFSLYFASFLVAVWFCIYTLAQSRTLKFQCCSVTQTRERSVWKVVYELSSKDFLTDAVW